MESLKKMGKRIAENRIAVFSCLAVFCYMWFLTAQCPYFSDDYHFKFVWLDFIPCGNDRRVAGLSDMLESMRNYYLTSGGRVLCHFMGYLFLFLDKWVFNMLNAVMFTALGVLLWKISFRGEQRKKYPFLLPAIFLALFFYIPSFGDNVLWLSGSVNYLWSMTLLLLAVYESERYLRSPAPKRLWKACAAVLISAFTSEITGGMLFVFLVIRIFADRKRAEPKAFLPLACTIPGAFFVVTAPGNVQRSADVHSVPFLSPEHILSMIPEYLVSLFSTPGLVYLLILFLIHLIYRIKTDGVREAILGSRFFIAGFAGLAALAMSGVYVLRPTAIPLILIAVNYAESALFAYDFIAGDPGRLFRGIAGKEELPEGSKKMLSLSVKGVPLLLALLFSVNLIGQTVHYTRKMDVVREYDSIVREKILSDGSVNQMFALETYKQCLDDFSVCFLYPKEAFVLTTGYQLVWYTLYCRTEEGLSQ